MTARVLPVNAAGEVLLLHGWDPAAPDAPYWFSVGGACEPGETLTETAARELLEETGIEVDAAAFGEPIAYEVGVEFDWGPYHLVQDQTWYAVALDADAEVHFRGLEALEIGTIDQAGWWTADALDADGSAAGEVLTDMMRLAVEAMRPSS
ncbi:MAG: NUDIX domain-containing protein [Chloroflexota bacterium]